MLHLRKLRSSPELNTGTCIGMTRPHSPSYQRPIRSYVLRSGRMTRGQGRALREYWPRYGVEYDGPIDIDKLFCREAPHFLEIGFGMGDELIQMAQTHPERDYLGIEVYEAGVGHLLGRAASLGIGNIRVVRDDAVRVLHSRIPDECIDALLLFFPDPWPKKRHHKRRIIQPEFAATVSAKLKRGGRLHIATDWEDYAYHMLVVLGGESRLVNIAGPRAFVARPAERPLTKFEKRGLKLGHRVWDLIYERPSDAAL